MPNPNDGLIAPYPLALQLASANTQETYLNGNPAFMRTNMPRNAAVGNLAALSTGVMTSAAVLLFAGDVVSKLTFISGGTAAGTPTHWWFGLYSNATTPALLAQTADQTSGAWAANTAVSLALSAAQTITTTGIYYAACMVAATTVPTLVGASVQTGAAGAVVTGVLPVAQTSGSALTTTAPATITSATTVGTMPYVLVN